MRDSLARDDNRYGDPWLRIYVRPPRLVHLVEAVENILRQECPAAMLNVAIKSSSRERPRASNNLSRPTQ